MQEKCVVCRQGTAHEIEAPAEVKSPTVQFVIVDDQRMRCDQCGEEYYTGEQADLHEFKVDAKKREQQRLLAPERITAIRARSGVSQRNFEAMVGMGTNTLSRIERGKEVQSKVVDNMLRLIDRDPAALGYLASEAGLTLEPKKKPGRQRAR
jgi:putative zinc finger/helix-turn-helix YgiT family protein